MKLIVAEPETRALRDLLGSWQERVSSVVALIEVERTAWRIGRSAIARAHLVLPRIALVELDDEVARTAATLKPAELRTLDAIHLATALTLGDDLGAFCTYDTRLAKAAEASVPLVLAPA